MFTLPLVLVFFCCCCFNSNLYLSAHICNPSVFIVQCSEPREGIIQISSVIIIIIFLLLKTIKIFQCNIFLPADAVLDNTFVDGLTRQVLDLWCQVQSEGRIKVNKNSSIHK